MHLSVRHSKQFIDGIGGYKKRLTTAQNMHKICIKLAQALVKNELNTERYENGAKKMTRKFAHVNFFLYLCTRKGLCL